MNFYCPAVSHSWKRQLVPLYLMSLLRKSTPMVGCVREGYIIEFVEAVGYELLYDAGLPHLTLP